MLISNKHKTYSATLKASVRLSLLFCGFSFSKSKRVDCDAKRCANAQNAIPSAQQDEKFQTFTWNKQ